MICPHCKVAVHENFEEFPLFTGNGEEADQVGWSISAQICPECGEPIIKLLKGEPDFAGEDEYQGIVLDSEYMETQVWPFGSSRTCPVEVLDQLKEDFVEAASVISISP